MSQIQLSQHIFDKVKEAANRQNLTPDGFVEALLEAQLLPQHPYVEMVQSRSQPRAVIKGTRIGVDVIVGYAQAGHTPQDIAAEILPQLRLAQIFDALSYYEDHREQIDDLLQAESFEHGQAYLQQRLGVDAAAQLLGKADGRD